MSEFLMIYGLNILRVLVVIILVVVLLKRSDLAKIVCSLSRFPKNSKR